MLRRFFVMILLLQFSIAGAAAGEWSLVKDSDDIRVYSRKSADSAINEVRAVTTVNTEVRTVVQLLRDHQSRPRWDSYSGEVFVHETLSPTEELLYLHSDLPWPVSDRDMLAHVKWFYEPGSGVVYTQSEATSGILPPRPGRIRVTRARQQWRLTPVAQGRVEISTEIFLDPAGPLPPWLVNMLSVDAPYNSLNGIRRVLGEGGFGQGGAEFIRDAE